MQTYLDRGTLAAYSGRYNEAGRAYPDVSAHGVDYLYNLRGSFVYAYGTSTSTPTFASLVALLNDRLLSTGKAPLGFLNPLLYSSGVSALNDITQGSNPGCGTNGFSTSKGWDPVSSCFLARDVNVAHVGAQVTGLGTPDFAKLLDVVKKLG